MCSVTVLLPLLSVGRHLMKLLLLMVKVVVRVLAVVLVWTSRLHLQVHGLISARVASLVADNGLFLSCSGRCGGRDGRGGRRIGGLVH